MTRSQAPLIARHETRKVRVLGTLLGVLLLVTGCSQSGSGSPTSGDEAPRSPSGQESSADPAACDDVTNRLLGAVQGYVDGFGAPLSSRAGEPSNPSGNGDQELRNALGTAREELQRNGCDLDAFGKDFASGIRRVTARGPLARAVLLRLTASMTGTLGTTPRTVTVRPGEDLARKLAPLAPGSTARLRPGVHRLARPLVLLSGVTLSGAGRGRTTLSSRAGGSAVLVLTPDRVELRRLALLHTGRAAASVLVGGPGSSVVLTDARLTGGRVDAGKSGPSQAGSGVVMTARPDETEDRGTTLELTRADLSGNAAAGVLLTGAHRASIRSSRFADNGQCGVCFAAASTGAVRRNTFTDNAVGVAVLDEARPQLVGNRYVGGQVGVQVSGRAAPAVRRATVDGATRAALIFGDSSRGRVDAVTCTRVPFGIVVSPKALPFLGDNECDVARGQ